MTVSQPVEAPPPLTALWHLRRQNGRTWCGDYDATGWPVVLHALERRGLWCGRCLLSGGAAAAELDQTPTSRKPPARSSTEAAAAPEHRGRRRGHRR